MSRKHRREQSGRRGERGATLWMVAASLFVLLGMAALSVDLVSLYVARSEAQRAADSAALAGAKKFIEVGLTTGLTSTTQAETLARAEAKTVGGQNKVGGQAADIRDEDVTFDFPVGGGGLVTNPRITVTVRRVAARANAVPTFFARAMGIAEADVAATAMAEAYNPSGGGPTIGTGCVKPWILPNCDPSPEHGGDPSACVQKWVDETAGTIVSPGAYPAGVVGQPLTIKQGDPQLAAAPSQFYPIQIPPGEEPALCPDCAQQTGSEGPGAALYARNIACCNTNTLTCGQQVDVQLQTGNMVGPTRMAVECLIHQRPNGSGQDELSMAPGYPQITGGSNNPNPLLRNQIISSSDSIVTIPLYDGHALCPGGSCGQTVTIVGFLQVFITQVDKSAQGRVQSVILNVAGCAAGGSGGGSSGGSGGGGTGGGGDTGSGGGGTINATPGGSLLPVRLIRP